MGQFPSSRLTIRVDRGCHARNLYDPAEARRQGFDYLGRGRSTAKTSNLVTSAQD